MEFRRGEEEGICEITASVRDLVSFCLRDDSIDNRTGAAAEQEAMLRGSRLHRKRQSSMGADYAAEVPLKKTAVTEHARIHIEGRADGVIRKDGAVTIDEIKGVYREPASINAPETVHRAQALLYAVILAEEEDLPEIGVQITYIHMDTEEIKVFPEVLTRSELTRWFSALLDILERYAAFYTGWSKVRDDSIASLSFPFPYRDGQKRLIGGVYQTITSAKNLFLMAPTGVGKTLAVLYPAVQAVGRRLAEKIFYLTARGAAQSAPQDALGHLRRAGVRIKSLQITAKEKACFMAKPSCNPDDCPYADHYFGRVRDVVLNMIGDSDVFDRETILRAAKDARLCPYELSLDLSYWADVIICDYNYVFDPDAYLRRFFSDAAEKKYILLVDEAHNLVDRGRAMYSADLVKEDVLAVRRLVKEKDARLYRELSKINSILLAMKKEDTGEERDGDEGGEDRDKRFGRGGVSVRKDDGGIADAAVRAMHEMERLFDESHDSALKEDLLDMYFALRSYTSVYDALDEHYAIYTEMTPDENFRIRLFCTDPSEMLRAHRGAARSAIFFSATLLPVEFYKQMLGAGPEDPAVYAPSSFPPENRKVLVIRDVSAKYTRRTKEEFRRIAALIAGTVRARKGNYIAFFPSYKMMEDVFSVYRSEYDTPSAAWVVQSRIMGEEDREIFLENFADAAPDVSMLGFCVMGGIFSEGIDLTGERLIGAIIVGTGLPQVSSECEIIRANFAEREMPGFDYAYRYPGMNKVLQAGGRVIRTPEDRGVIVLADERFLERNYAGLFPREWNIREVCRAEEAETALRHFWEDEDRQ
ncbi:MAG: PD-(D/E)XK nuclease family protein [Lachnospiraceae bacterium]|nr:PD-(D/E)XK nuclease family protein [Lachnospiraceae bacterium]